MEKEVRQMSIKEMWNYLIFQTKGYRQLGAAIVAGAVCGAQDELKSFLGEEYQDYDLVVALPNGRPCENRIIEKEFSLLKEKAGLPNVVFHSLRHSSTTYKLKLNHGDLKATQGMIQLALPRKRCFRECFRLTSSS